MPSGRTHALATTLTAAIVSPTLVILAAQPINSALAFASGCMAGILLTPDLDVDHRTQSYSVIRRSFGWFIAEAWYWFWLPYARLLPHRSPWSHTPIIGTLLRLAYLLFIPMILWGALQMAFNLPQLPELSWHPLWGWAITGLMLVDTVHIFMDWAS